MRPSYSCKHCYFFHLRALHFLAPRARGPLAPPPPVATPLLYSCSPFPLPPAPLTALLQVLPRFHSMKRSASLKSSRSVRPIPITRIRVRSLGPQSSNHRRSPRTSHVNRRRSSVSNGAEYRVPPIGAAANTQPSKAATLSTVCIMRVVSFGVSPVVFKARMQHDFDWSRKKSGNWALR